MPRKPQLQTTVPGFGSIYQPRYRNKRDGQLKKSAIWWMTYKFRIDDKPVFRSTKCRDQVDAFNELLKMAGRRACGEIRDSAPERVLISQLLDSLLAHYEEQGNRSLYDLKCRVERTLRPAFGSMRAIDLTGQDLKSWVSTAKQGSHIVRNDGDNRKQKALANSSINRCLANLHTAFQLAAEHDPPLVIRIPRFPLQREDNTRQGILEHDQYTVLRDDLASHARLVLVLGYHTGMRRGEILSLRWEQVDFETGVIHLEKKQVKNKNPRVAPIYGEMRAYLEMAKSDRDSNHRECPWVVSFNGKRVLSIKTSWNASLRRLKLPHILVHDLRRTAATNMDNCGIKRSVIMQIAGWKTEAMFRRYRIGNVREVVEAGKTMDLAMQERAAKRETGAIQ